MRFLLLFCLLITLSTQVFSQSCDLDYEDFTNASNTNEPLGWIRGAGTNIGTTTPTDSLQDPAVGFNNIDEYLISDEYKCMGQICFDWHASSAPANFDVEIAWTQDMVTWNPIDTIITEGSGAPTTYVQHCVAIESEALQPPFLGRIRWKMTRRTSSGRTFYLENICISDTFCVVTPTQLTFSQITEQCREPNIPFAMTICATDSNGYVTDTVNSTITVTKLSGPGDLAGTLSMAAVNGCATVSDISFNQAGSYVLQASAGSLMGGSDTILMTSSCPNEVSLKVMSYNLLNYSSGRNDCGANTVVPARWDTLEKIAHYYLPDVLMVCEIQNDTIGVNQILNASLNSNGYSNYAAAEFVLNGSPGGTNFNNMMYYNQNKLTLYEQSEIGTLTRDFNKYTFYVKDGNLSVTQDTVFLDFYMAHLKAGSASVDSSRRAQECDSLRAHLDNMPDRNSILGGDLNFYTANEQGYQTLLSGTNPLNDPVDMPGDWDSNFAFRSVHTQSSREPGAPNYDCGFSGGADSRFDFLLISNAILNSTLNVQYVDESYSPFGNDGSIFNKAINDLANTSGIPMDVLNALYYMSDHLPVVMELNVILPEISCPEILVVSGNPIEVGEYYADKNITSTGVINSPDSVLFQANQCIFLNEDFEVFVGATFEVVNAGCE